MDMQAAFHRTTKDTGLRKSAGSSALKLKERGCPMGRVLRTEVREGRRERGGDSASSAARRGLQTSAGRSLGLPGDGL